MQVLPRLASLRDVAVERCHGAVVLHSLWAGLAGCSRLEALSITGSAAGGGLPEAAGSLRLPSADLLLPPACRCFEAALPGQAPSHRASCPQAAGSVPPTVALLQHLRRLDLSGNGLAALPDALAYCQQLTAVRLAGNRLQGVPVGLAALGGLRHLDLSANQVGAGQRGGWRGRLNTATRLQCTPHAVRRLACADPLLFPLPPCSCARCPRARTCISWRS